MGRAALLAVGAVAVVAFCRGPGSGASAGDPTLMLWVPTLASGAAAGLSDNLARVSPSDKPPARRSTAAVLAAARGEVESFQIIARGTAPITSLDLTASPLIGPRGAEIPVEAFDFYREHYTEVTRLHSAARKGRNPSQGKGSYADGLIPYRTWAGEPFGYARTGQTVEPHANQGLWIDVRVPRSPSNGSGTGCGGAPCPAGTYRGAVTVTAITGGKTLTATVPVTLTLWDFELPLVPSLQTAFGDLGDMGAGYLRPTAMDVHLRKVLLLQNGIAPQLIGPRFHDAGAKDELKRRLAGYRERYGLASNRIALFADTLDRACNIRRPCDQWLKCSPPAYASPFLIAEIEARPRGIVPYIQIGDEQYASTARDWCPGGVPENNYRVVREWNRAARENVVDGRRALTLVTANAGGGIVYNSIGNSRAGATGAAADVYAPLLDYMFRDIEAYRTVKALGAVHWSYTTLVPDTWSPKWMLDWAPINERIFTGLMAQALELKGVLLSQIDSRYREDMWRADPAGQEDTNFNEAMVYPGAFIGYDGPAPSMRLFWVRKGIEDYEYVQLLRRRGEYEKPDSCGVGSSCRAVVEAVAGRIPLRSLSPNEGIAWNKDPAALQGARYVLGQRLHALGTR